MDLRSIINNEGGGERSKQAQAQAQAPATPIQATPHRSPFREHSQPPSYGKQPPQDYGHQGQLPFASPSSYQAAPYQGHPSQPPPLHTSSQPDIRSPGPTQYTAQSPYQRHTPSAPVGGGGYPFPSSGPPQSPSQQPHPYPSALHQRESYGATAQPPQLQHQGSHGSYSQQSPHTPTIVTPGQGQQYFQHQRSQSSQSITTPTSAQSQAQLYSQHPHASPVSAHAYPPQQQAQHHRQQSQPGTPLGPPIGIPRQSSGSFQPPTSPYQQRPPSSGMGHPSQQARVSPARQATQLPPRNLSNSSAYDSHRNSIEEQHRRSQSSRERSLSVSPKTQIHPFPRSEAALQQQASQFPNEQVRTQQVQNQSYQEHMMNVERLHRLSEQQQQRQPETRQAPLPPAQSPGQQSIQQGAGQGNVKRKMDEMENSRRASSTSSINGIQQAPITPSSPMQPVKKRVRYAEPPIWARSFLGRVKKGNASMTNYTPNGSSQVKAEPQTQIKSEQRNEPNGHVHVVANPVRPSADTPGAQFSGPLGAWEPSIQGSIPLQEIPRIVADWLFLTVVNRPDAGELRSRGVEIEIEAKLGQLIDAETNQRMYLPVRSECVLTERNRVNFKSSMTEAQHQFMNEYLNKLVVETDPRNGHGRKPSVQIHYNHRRERDTFYELPQAEYSSLPASIRAEINKRHTVKVRVTHDQRTGQELAKIIKARVGDLNIFLPGQALDCRISVNLEMRYDGDIEGLAAPLDSARQPDRNKDRMSYKQNHYQIDLTQVTTADSTHPSAKEHELEIELSAQAIIDQGRKAANGEAHKYPELVEGFVNNIRILARAVPELGVAPA